MEDSSTVLKRASQGFYFYNGPYNYGPETNIHCLPAWCIC